MIPRSVPFACAAFCLLGLPGCTADGGAARSVPPLASPPGDAPLAGLVHPFIGTTNEGHTYPGAVRPWGMASPSPHTTLTDPIVFLDGTVSSSGYLYGEPLIHGFGQTHLSGTGCPDLGAPVLVPTVGSVAPYPDDYGSAYEREHAYAGYYAVRLTDPDVYVELTATERAGVHRFWFPERAGDANVLIDVGRSLSWRQGEGTVRVLSGTEVEGSVMGGLFCAEPNRPVVHFVARFSEPAVQTGTWQDGALSSDSQAAGRAGAFLRFWSSPNTPLEVRVGLSYVSTDGARANLDAETSAQSFDAIRDAAARSWQQALSRIRVFGATEADQVRFYTALYHALIHPNVLSDRDGSYLEPAGAIAHAAEDRYTVFSLWDTYRTTHPLLTLVYPERQLGMLRTLAALARGLDHPPLWELAAEEVNMMVGDPAAIVVADSVEKGLTDFDLAGLYPRLRAGADDPDHRPGLGSYLALGYVPMEEADEVWGPVSTTLEYALADAALARLAESLGETDDHAALEARSQNWATLYDETSGLLRPRNRDGSFFEPFDADALEGSSFQPRAGGPGYVEGTAYHYAFFVPHDMASLVARHGDATFVDRLQRVFDTERFVMWNEPDIAYPYLFAYVSAESWRAQRAVRQAMDRFFGPGPDGLPGNDDAGTLSAWFVFSAIGLYPDAPGTPRYTLGSPLFERVEIDVGAHTAEPATFVIEAVDNGPNRPYVRAAKLDGSAHESPFIDHGRVLEGGVLQLQMSDSPPAGR